MTRTRKALLFVCGSALLLGTSAALAGTIIVRSTGPSAKSYPPGKSLPANGQIALKAGDAVTILDAGGTHVMTGPGSFPVAQGGGTATGSAFAQFLKNVGGRQSRSAASRGDNDLPQTQSPNLWYADISKAGSLCIVDPTAVTLWRPSPTKPLTLTLSHDGKTARVQFAKGQSTQPWPIAELPLVNNAAYQLAASGQSKPMTITIRTVKPAPAALPDAASALIKNGCAAQIDLLVDTAS